MGGATFSGVGFRALRKVECRLVSRLGGPTQRVPASSCQGKVAQSHLLSCAKSTPGYPIPPLPIPSSPKREVLTSEAIQQAAKVNGHKKLKPLKPLTSGTMGITPALRLRVRLYYIRFCLLISWFVSIRSSSGLGYCSLGFLLPPCYIQ